MTGAAKAIERAQPTLGGHIDDDDANLRIHWSFFGEPEARETFVFMNGLAMGTESWLTSVGRVYPEYNVLLFDYPGQGASTRRDQPITIPQICGYLARILDGLAIDRVHTQGVSYGGFVTAEFGRLHPDRLLTQTLSGILLSNTHTFRMYQDLSMAFYARGPAVFDLYTHYLYEKLFSEKFLERIHDKIERMRLKFYENYREQPYCLARLTEAQDELLRALDANLVGYRAVSAPTLIVAGEYDRVVPAWAQQAMTSVFPQCRFVLLPRCGHLTYFEEPDAFWGNLRALARAKSVQYRTAA